MAGKHLNAMAERWEHLARENPMFYIATSRRDWNAAEFYASGRQQVEWLMNWMGSNGPRQRALDIGCGLGRLSAALAAHFDRVDGVDISAAMVDQARCNNLPPNVFLSVVSGDRLDEFEPDTFDLVYSGHVFQHIPDAAVLCSYLGEIRRVLRRDGRAALHFDTRPERLWHRTYKSLPDILLPRTHRRFIRRYRRAAPLLRQWMHDARLHILAEHEPDSAGHVFLLAPAPDQSFSSGRNGA